MEERQKALLVGANLNNKSDFKESMEELCNLAIACDFEVVGEIVQNLKSTNNSHYIGTGKVKEVLSLLEEHQSDVVIFNNELTPSQLRNLEKTLKCRILDRTALILEIFAQRAKTHEAKLQVEVTNLKYMLPRLMGSREELGRQGGGVGTKNKGVGEKKIELDRRKIEERIVALNKELENIVFQRQTQRKRRNKRDLPLVSLVGYTNAGKSTVMNGMIDTFKNSDDKKVFEKDMLFATLETSVRSIILPDNKNFLLSDTVGFVSNLPHDLIKAFRSTLEEVCEADLLIHVVDFSNPNYKHQIEVTIDTLNQIGAGDIPVIYAYNKVDLVEGPITEEKNHSVFISAKKKIGMDNLIKLISQKVFTDYVHCEMLIPYDKGDVVSYLREKTNVKSIKYESNGTLLALECSKVDYVKYEEFIIAHEL
ncbi:GTPase HflX [Clostridium sp.]|uniref:GTPase HflX n=1 Tax=Clostridium sp. TaxID=1506 RepID=UPI002FC95E01